MLHLARTPPSEPPILYESTLEVVDEFDEGTMMILSSMLGVQVSKLILGVHVINGALVLLH